MTMKAFTCDTFAEHLPAYLEGDASPEVRAAMEAHAAACNACAGLLADIARIEREAGELPTLAPARDLWGGIAKRIDAPVVPIWSAVRRRPTAGGAGRAGTRRWWTHPALAAAALVGVTAGVTHYLTRESLGPGSVPAVVAVAPQVTDGGATVEAERPLAVAAGDDAAGDAGAAPSARSAEVATGARGGTTAGGARTRFTPSGVDRRPAAADVRTVAYRQGDIAALDSLYYREIMRLRRVLATRRGTLDPATVAVIDRNMLVIDRAIRECRAALAADPASTFLNEQLNEALESKIELLRTAAMMPIGS